MRQVGNSASRQAAADSMPPDMEGPTERDGSRTAHLRREVVDLFRRGMVPGLLSLLCACGLVALLWNTLSAAAAAAWLFTHVLIAAGRLLLVSQFKRQRIGDDLLWRWRGHYINAALVTGLAWGVGSVLLVARAPQVQQVSAWVVLGAAVLVEFPALARLGRAFAWLLLATLVAPLVLMLLGPQPLPAAAGALVLLACASALAGLDLRRTYIDGLQMQMEFARLARFDQLTGLANRRYFDETLGGEWQRALRLSGEVALLIFDVDEFKPYNDHYGHPGGDACLRRLAAAAREVVHRPGDLVARIGGEEFAVLLPLTSLNGATAVAEMVRLTVERMKLPHAPGATHPVVTISVGVASMRPDSDCLSDDLVKAADAALYEAKHAGRNCVMSAPQVEEASPAARRLREALG